ncbi:testis-specific serine/threonine-protein kinase 3-like [Halichondria panicea]|uniref:testis-specific serine/threonine-protein kinase 3-like n=1 Tax=Halichondria panicea TaxID=6063 RepID=UPI00312B36E1
MPNEGTTIKRSAVTPNAQYGIHKFGYILGKTLGSGAYAKVKTATSLKKGGNEVAVKIIDKRSAPKDVVSKFLPREVEVLKILDHDTIIKLIDVIDTPDTMYLVMELASSGDLLDFINSRRYLSERVARNLFIDLVNGIEVCHSMNIVHRDLKCENLLLDGQLKLKISDFGFARKTEGKNLETYCGSYAYAAPEVILGQPYMGEAADVWSMGVVLFAMLAGKLPFKDSDVKTLLAEISSVLVYPSRLTGEVKSLVSKMLTFTPHERITVAEIQTHPWMKMPTLPLTSRDGKKKTTKDKKQGSSSSKEPPKVEVDRPNTAAASSAQPPSESSGSTAV